jgi:hypothetical protein
MKTTFKDRKSHCLISDIMACRNFLSSSLAREFLSIMDDDSNKKFVLIKETDIDFTFLYKKNYALFVFPPQIVET